MHVPYPLFTCMRERSLFVCTQIKHMVIVETDQMYVQRQRQEREATAARPPLVVSHK